MLEVLQQVQLVHRSRIRRPYGGLGLGRSMVVEEEVDTRHEADSGKIRCHAVEDWVSRLKPFDKNKVVCPRGLL